MAGAAANSNAPSTPSPRAFGDLPFDVLHDVFEFLEWPAVRTGPARASRRLREAAHAEGLFFRLVRRDVVFAPARKSKSAKAALTDGAAVAQHAVSCRDSAHVGPTGATADVEGSGSARRTSSTPTMRSMFARWGSATTHAIITPSFCELRCDPCWHQQPAPTESCPQTRMSIVAVESKHTPESAPASARAKRLQLKYDSEPIAIPVTVRSVSAADAVSPVLVENFGRMCDRVAALGAVEDAIFFDPAAVSMRFNATPPTSAPTPGARRWVLRELLAGPFAPPLRTAFFAPPPSIGARVLVQVGVVSNAKLYDPFDMSSKDCRMRSDPSRRPAASTATGGGGLPEFYMQGIPWRYARTHAELIGVLDEAGAACARAMTKDPNIRMSGTTWFLRITTTPSAANNNDNDDDDVTAPAAPWTSEQLAGKLPPPPLVRGYLNIGYHAQFATQGGVGGGLSKWAVEEGKSVSTLIRCLQERFAAVKSKSYFYPVREAMSSQLHADAIRRRTGALIIAVLPDRGVRDPRRIQQLLQSMDDWVPRDPPQ